MYAVEDVNFDLKVATEKSINMERGESVITGGLTRSKEEQSLNVPGLVSE